MAKRGVNTVTIIGTMGAEPKVQQFSNGSSTVVSLATSESWTDKQSGSKVEETEWHRIVLKGKHADVVAQGGRKGRDLYVVGKLKSRKYTVGTVEKSITEIIVDDFDGQCHFVDNAGTSTRTSSAPPQRQSRPQQGAQPYGDRQPAHSPQSYQAPPEHADLSPPPQMEDLPEYDESFFRNVPV
ncbi:single-stranded DNA-binding protein [Pseudomonas veronii 1YdBTEX2]|uniref:Single-stranded DNA-binding protein n=1 Tax=Pseudomonas veronii 1YdBTEX2 TaxID=1295141 RepID=A0A1D3K7U2_PSEVE|nr:single-stranded DNA-binding protein [Pseudomonas veronii 1YdBTEX2]